ncbi:hypothetical protein E3P78_03969 [Wallemia ichthyophaga]|nr:hypothetical protein E3P78_03969 [Wallemia ichthyophaga]
MKLFTLSLALPLLSVVAAAPSPLDGRSDHPIGEALEDFGHDVGDAIIERQTDIGNTVVAIGDTIFHEDDSNDDKISKTYNWANENIGNGIGTLFAGLVDMSEGIALNDTSQERADSVRSKYADANENLGEGLTNFLNATQLFAEDINNKTLDLDIFPPQVKQYIQDYNNATGSAAGDLLNTFALSVEHEIYDENGPSTEEVKSSFKKTVSELGDRATAVHKILKSAWNDFFNQ